MNKTEWNLRACRDADRELFFDDHDPGPAQAICLTCPIRQFCLDWALTKPERYGVWGGTTEEDRRLLGYRKQRRRCPRCGSRELTTLERVQACRRCAVSWHT